jgi:UDP-N-acetylmuramate--alanine ligase
LKHLIQRKMTFKEAQNIYCLGIGGIGVSGLARLAIAMGKNVAGSDLKRSAVTDGLEKLGIKINIGSNQIPGQPDLVIYTPAIPAGEVEAIQTPKLSHGAAVGQLMADYYGIAVTGTNGKSTTSAMLGLFLEYADFDPTVILGSLLSPKNENEKFQANARLGASKYLVAESDEYHGKMLENRPQMIVLTNVAEDRLDYYKNLEHIKSAFIDYVKSVPADGFVIYNADDHNSVEVGRHAISHKRTYGIHHYGDLQAVNVESQDGSQSFDLHLQDEMIGRFTLKVPGLFNVSNALAATLAAIQLGIKPETIQKALANYAGIWRRFETVGYLDSKPVISDYAHHPAGITATLEAAKQLYKDKKILTVFQPHQRNRTLNLLKEFAESLVAADEIILLEIFDVAGREVGEKISSQDLANELEKMGEVVQFVPDLETAETLIRSRAGAFDAILLMGAGDIDDLARKLGK